MRWERDSLGEVEVADDALWGAQTQRSLRFFAIGEERMPLPIVHALAQIKAAAARVNGKLGVLAVDLVDPIALAADEVAAGQWDAQFPLRIWQTGSGTQSNMNVNEVIANLANERLGGARGSKSPVHPNDHVNLGQSSNDVFPSALHISVAAAIHGQLLPALQDLRDLLQQRSQDFADILKIGRTHLMDAVPMRLGQEFSGYVDQLRQGETGIRAVLPRLYALALGGTAVGTGLNTHPDFARQVCMLLEERLSMPLHPAENAFAALAGQEALCQLSGQLRSLAMSLLKIANDIRWMGSGPRAGLGELALPENEPGSSIMPGKVNPTQAEALSMVCAQIFGNDATVAFAASQGNFELNVYKPVIGYNVLQSITLLADAMRSFALHCVQNLQARRDNLQAHLDSSLMLVTALVPSLGYERAAKIAQRAHQEGSTLRAAALASGWIDAAQLDEILRPERMLAPDRN
ncbi:class II fumarate hydratase [Acidithiobacillus sp. AMEEHan]|uniref:class II fumarate hydratase n=1 Tax=Acidithiobacillus sp. AMEEHan TaxID=2994951 RepID=UPI0027E5A11B|nr:class II fumarate hydratase [Acidithiobacillus sp. AMEEHan]